MKMHSQKNVKQSYKIEKIAESLSQISTRQMQRCQKNKNNQNYSTLRDSLVASERESSVSTKTLSQAESTEQQRTHRKKNSFTVDKSIAKYAEPKFQKLNSIKILQKFNGDTLTSSLSNLNHEITNTETDLLEIDEKIPQSNLDKFEASRIVSIENIEFDFSVLVEIENCYEEILKDLNGNKLENKDYKEKVGGQYLRIVLSDENKLDKIFEFNKDVNIYLIQELSLFLLAMFFGNFTMLSEAELFDLKTCLSYSHRAFLYVMNTLVTKTKAPVDENLSYTKCITLLKINAKKSKYDIDSFQREFKIAESTLGNLFSNLADENEDKTILNVILEIFSLRGIEKFTKIKEGLTSNAILMDKVREIISRNEQTRENAIDEEDEDEELPQPEPPFLPEKSPNDKREYTLVLDLDETLVHYYEDEEEGQSYVKVRMGTETFIETLSNYCEIVIFTAGEKRVSFYI